MARWRDRIRELSQGEPNPRLVEHLMLFTLLTVICIAAIAGLSRRTRDVFRPVAHTLTAPP